MIDPAAPLLTRDGVPAEFVCDDRHRVYPLTFRVAGRLLSYTREGRYDLSGEHPLDLFPAGADRPFAQLGLEL